MTERDNAILSMARQDLDRARSAWRKGIGTYNAVRIARDRYNHASETILGVSPKYCMVCDTPGATWYRPNPHNRMMDVCLCQECISRRQSSIR